MLCLCRLSLALLRACFLRPRPISTASLATPQFFGAGALLSSARFLGPPRTCDTRIMPIPLETPPNLLLLVRSFISVFELNNRPYFGHRADTLPKMRRTDVVTSGKLMLGPMASLD